jgi:hypothetical protein
VHVFERRDVVVSDGERVLSIDQVAVVDARVLQIMREGGGGTNMCARYAP